MLTTALMLALSLSAFTNFIVINSAAAMAKTVNKMVQTPHGLRPSQCVHQIEEPNHLITEIHDIQSPGVLVEYPDSNRKLFYPQLPECVENAKVIRSEWKHNMQKYATHDTNGGWVLYGYAYTPANSNIHSFYSTYTLPNEMPVSSEQILYYFIGLTDMSDNNETILQPVIAYCPDGDCGYSWEHPGWMGAAWNCCPSGMTWYSDSIELKPGSVVENFVECDDMTGHATISLSYEKTQNATLNLGYDDRQFNFATVTLEAYDYDGCENLNSEPFLFDDMKLTMLDGSNWKPDWTPVNELEYCQASITFSDGNLEASIVGHGV